MRYQRHTWQRIVAEQAGRIADLENKLARLDKRFAKLKGIEPMKKGTGKIAKVMGEYERGKLHSGSKKGPVVTKPAQAKAIALHEAREAGAKIPRRKGK